MTDSTDIPDDVPATVPADGPDDDVHTVPRDGAWVNEVLGHVVGGSFASLEEAVAAGREEARSRGVEHRVDDESAVGGTSDAGGFVEKPDTRPLP